ncbi:MAG: TDP-N-acetylfucosamine:lipid II N-acetylfucosaminyltransferase [Bacteroidales bacterium]|nr:TDP-N-acetylfucosamine:lipid II N-acetylfucosaminyltransferase [Bacteroidales bacterium]
MNYHIIPQDSFFTFYIEDVYKLHQEHNNIFWIRGNENDEPDKRIFSTNRPVVYLGTEKGDIIRRLRAIHPNDKIIVFWYDTFIGECILESAIPNPLYVTIMGGDFYNEIDSINDKWLYDRHTRRIASRLYTPQINFHRKPSNWGKIIADCREKRKFKKNIAEAYRRKEQTVARINYLMTSECNEAEVDLVKRLYPSCHAEYCCIALNQNFDTSCDIATPPPYDGSRSLKVLLGNSAYPMNNHIDACLLLQRSLPADYFLLTPLSYGDKPYADLFLKWGKKHLGKKFQPITDYMARQDYINMLASIDIAVMFHNRQQAFGNIITMLTLGKPVFMKSQSVIYTLLKKIGIAHVYDVQQLRHLDLSTVCQAARADRPNTIAILRRYYSEESRLRYMSDLIGC